MFESSILVFAGLIIGTASAFFGIGGGVIAIPTLYALFPHIDAQSVIGTSLGMIFVNSLINLYNYSKNNFRPEKSFVIFCSFFMVFGVVVGAKIALILNTSNLKAIFAVFLPMVAIKNLIVKIQPPSDNWKPPIGPAAAITTMIGGIVSGITGLGGGGVLIPLYMGLLKMPRKFLPVYTNSMMAIGTLFGMISYAIATASKDEIFQNFQIGHINMALIGLLFIGSFFGSKIGSSLIHKVSDKTSKYLFSALLTAISTKILLSL